MDSSFYAEFLEFLWLFAIQQYAYFAYGIHRRPAEGEPFYKIE
jgi:hypothetical protein